MDEEQAKCCYCNDPCNPCSQCCGKCARLLTGYILGWNVLPQYLKHVYPENLVKKEDADRHKKKKNCG